MAGLLCVRSHNNLATQCTFGSGGTLHTFLKILIDTKRFHDFFLSGDDRNIEEVYVCGKQVVPFSSSV